MEHMLWRFSSGLSLSLTAIFLVGVATASAQPSTIELTSREKTALAESFATERLWVWQKRLNLQDWNIAIVVARSSELKPKTLGNIHWDLDKKTAVIRVLDPADYRLPYKDMLQDMEFTVVHELIHLGLAPVFSDLQRSDANRREEEHNVNHLTDALLRLDRGK
jgi:hypothetical protein